MKRREKILVADRNPRFLASTEHLLEDDGFTVHTVRTIAAAKRALGEFTPDILLTGAQLPGGDGFALCKHVKEVFDPTLPCVLLFSEDDQSSVTACRKVGADNYLIRPLKRRELLACVRSMVLIRKLRVSLDKQERGSIESQAAGAPGTGVRDPRTGFYTFGYFKEALYVEVKRARRYHYPLAVILAAYDRDTLSQAETAMAGSVSGLLDELYGGLALAVRRSIRDTDIPVSYTENNILILTPHTDLDGAVAVAKRIRAVIKRSRLSVDGVPLSPTLSMGLSASASSEKISFASLVKASSGALQFALERGGNRIVY